MQGELAQIHTHVLKGIFCQLAGINSLAPVEAIPEENAKDVETDQCGQSLIQLHNRAACMHVPRPASYM